MFEKTPRIVYFPELGSMCAASHVSQARSCGFDCTLWSCPASGAGATHFPVLATGLHIGSCTGMTAQTFIDSLSSYPRWLVIAAATLVAALLVWIVAKLLEWTLWLILIVVIVGGLAWAGWTLMR